MYLVWVNGDKHRRPFLGYSSRAVLLKVPGSTDLDRFGVANGVLEKGKQLVVVSRAYIDWD